MKMLLEHLHLVVWSTTFAVLIGVPLGIFCQRSRRAGPAVLALIAVLQVVPSLALFGLLLPVPVIGGIGARTATIALVLYALLPIARATATGIAGIDASVREAAVALGMTSFQRLYRVELPLALPVIASGVRTALVIGVGVATIAAAIGAGGFGTLIFRGLRMNDTHAMLTGALGAAGLALALDWTLAWIVHRLNTRRSVAGFAILPLALLFTVTPSLTGSVTICTKDFAEQVYLGETLAKALESRGTTVVRRFELGGSLCHEALLAGSVDIYPEYTGTALVAILHEQPDYDAARIHQQVRHEYAQRWGIDVSEPIGFSNDFALVVRDNEPARAISQLVPSMRVAFGQDFMSRPDGYAGLSAAYNLHFTTPPVEMDLALTYRALAAGQVDVIVGNSTDGLIDKLHLKVLVDDKHYFPPYQAVWLSRAAVRDEVEDAVESIHISTEEMRRINARLSADQ